MERPHNSRISCVEPASSEPSASAWLFCRSNEVAAWTFSGFNQGDLNEYQACRYWTGRARKRSVDVRCGIGDAERASAGQPHRRRNVQCRQGAPGLRSLGPLLLATGLRLRTAPSRMASSSALLPPPPSSRAPSSRRASWWRPSRRRTSRRTPPLIISEGALAPSPFSRQSTTRIQGAASVSVAGRPVPATSVPRGGRARSRGRDTRCRCRGRCRWLRAGC